MSNHKPLRVSETSWILEQLFTAGVTEEVKFVQKTKRVPKAKVELPVAEVAKTKKSVVKVTPKQKTTKTAKPLKEIPEVKPVKIVSKVIPKADKTVKAKPATKITAPAKKTKSRK